MISPPAPEKYTETEGTDPLFEASLVIRAELERRVSLPPLSTWMRRTNAQKFATWEEFSVGIQKAENPLLATQLCVQALLVLPVDAEFPARLRLAAGHAEWLSRLTDVAATPEVFPALLDLCDLLPHGEATYLEGRFARALLYVRQGNFVSEQGVYEQLLRREDLAPAYRLVAWVQLGKSLENTGEYAAALKPYNKVELFAEEAPLAADALLRAVFINLHLGEMKEALRIIRVLEEVGESVLKEAQTAGQIREFVEVAKSGDAEKFWNGAKTWWPLWLSLKANLGLEGEEVAEVVPAIGDSSPLDLEIQSAERAKDVKRFFRLYGQVLSGSRWLPRRAIRASELSVAGIKLLPQNAAALNNLLIAMMQLPSPGGVRERSRQAFLAAHLLDAERAPEVIALVAKYWGQSGEPEVRADQSMLRIWGLAAVATRTQREECASALAQCLDDSEMVERRAQTVQVLASVFRSLGRGEDEQALLVRETLHPAVVGDVETCKKLEDRRHELGSSMQIKTQIEAWLKTIGLEWYDHAEPKSLADPRLNNLESVLQNPAGRFIDPEMLKLRLLVAQDPGRTLDEQHAMWSEALSALVPTCRMKAAARGLIEPLIEGETVTHSMRIYALWEGIVESLGQREVADFRRWSAHPLAKQLNPDQQKALPLIGRILEIDPSDVEKTAAMVRELAEKELGLIEAFLVQMLLGDLLRMGETKVVADLCAQMAKWQFRADVSPSPRVFQMEVARRVAAVERMAPLHAALSTKVLAKYPQAPDELPPAYRAFRVQRVEHLEMAEREETRLAFLYMVKKRLIRGADMGLWSRFLSALPVSESDGEFALGLLRTALEVAVDDEQRAEVVASIGSALDCDQPGVRPEVVAMLAPYRNPVSAPATYAKIRFMEIFWALRLGQSINFETAFEQVRDPAVVFWRAHIKLRHYVQTRDLPALRRLVNEENPDVLLNPHLLDASIRAFDLLGRTAEAKMAREAGSKLLKDLVLFSWVMLDEQSLDFSVRLGFALGDPQLLPEGWFKTLETQMTPRMRPRMRILEGWLRGEWETVFRNAETLAHENPSDYHSYWYLGYSAAQLGRKENAITALTTYVTYSKDELEYPEAIELLKTLGR